MIDAHCHLDLYPDPLAAGRQAERFGNTVVAVTNLPSHYEMGLPHVRTLARIHLALGLHPLLSDRHAGEIARFVKHVAAADYIGEIGLDFSSEGFGTRDRQVASFRRVLAAIADRQRFVTLHSRRAERELLGLLDEFGIRRAVFHWFTGSVPDMVATAAAGHYFSVNPAMIASDRGRRLVSAMPRHRIITETDGPYVMIDHRPIGVCEVRPVIDFLAGLWTTDVASAARIVDLNFRSVLDANLDPDVRPDAGRDLP
jgi:TatD DNase family protein